MAQELKRILRGGLHANVPMSRYTTIGVGGNARILAEPATISQVSRIVGYAFRNELPYVVVGKGSNLIVRDGGYDGMVIRLGTHMARIRVNERTVRAEGGASFALLSRKLTRMGRKGLEFGIGIPGTVGGAVRMNAGAFGGEVSEVLQRVKYIDEKGDAHVQKASDMKFSYRQSSLPRGAIVLSATFACPRGAINKDVYERSLGRKETQPISERTFGSTFVNPPGAFAAQMIEECGLKGQKKGGAMISDKHANFIVNVDGNARAEDVEGLIRLMRDEVRKQFGITLKTEVIVIGNRQDET